MASFIHAMILTALQLTRMLHFPISLPNRVLTSAAKSCEVAVNSVWEMLALASAIINMSAFFWQFAGKKENIPF